MILSQVRVRQCLLSAGPPVGIQCQQLLQQVHGQGIGTPKVLGEVLLGLVGQLLHVLPCTLTGDLGEELLVWCAHKVEDLVQLVNVWQELL